MEIFLANGLKPFTGGQLVHGCGYHIQKRKSGFYGVRKSRGIVPQDGHLRFIFACAELARTGLHISDVTLGAVEFHSALKEARKFLASQWVKHNLQKGVKTQYNAQDIINLKTTFGL